MSKQIIECVPNISEGRDADKIRIISQIVEEIDGLLAEVEGVGKVHGHYYLLATELYKTEGDHANYYR